MNKEKLTPRGFCSKPMTLFKRELLKRKGFGWEDLKQKPPTRKMGTINTILSGGRMKIKFDGYKEVYTNPNANGKTFKQIMVTGEALEGKSEGQEWSTRFFANKQDLKEQVEGFSKGDIVNVRMVKNGKYWNVEGFEASEAPAPSVGTAIPPTLGGCSCETNAKFDNLELATSILGPKGPKEDAFKYLSKAAGVADLIQDYIDEKGAFQFGKETSDSIPELDVPTED